MSYSSATVLLFVLLLSIYSPWAVIATVRTRKMRSSEAKTGEVPTPYMFHEIPFTAHEKRKAKGVLGDIRKAMISMTNAPEVILDSIRKQPPHILKCLLLNGFHLNEKAPTPLTPSAEDVWTCHGEYDYARIQVIQSAERFGKDSALTTVALQKLEIVSRRVFMALRNTQFDRENEKKTFEEYRNINQWKALFGIYSGNEKGCASSWEKHDPCDKPKTGLLQNSFDDPEKIPPTFFEIRRRFEVACHRCHIERVQVKNKHRSRKLVLADYLFWTSDRAQRDMMTKRARSDFYQFTERDREYMHKAWIDSVEESFRSLEERLPTYRKIIEEIASSRETAQDATNSRPKKDGTAAQASHGGDNGVDESDREDDANSDEDAATEDSCDGPHTSEMPHEEVYGKLYVRELQKAVPQWVLQEASTYVVETLRREFGGVYLDVYFKITEEADAGTPKSKVHHEKGCIDHIKKEVETADGAKEMLTWTVLHNCLSPYMKSRILTDANQTLWMSSEDYAPNANRGKSRYARIADLNGRDGTFHLKATGLLCGAKMTNVERDVHKIMFGVMKLMDEAIETYIQKTFQQYQDHRLPRYRLSQLQMIIGTVLGASYSRHSDASPMLCKNANIDGVLAQLDSDITRLANSGNGISRKRRKGPTIHDFASQPVVRDVVVTQCDGEAFYDSMSEEEGSEQDESEDNSDAASETDDAIGNEDRIVVDAQQAVPEYELVDLPELWELRVPTLTLCNFNQPEEEYGKKGNALAKVSFFSNKDIRLEEETNGKKKAKPIAEIACFACTLHIQGFGVQEHTEHVVTQTTHKPKIGESRLVRLVISGRNPMVKGKEKYYNEVMRHHGLLNLQPIDCYDYRGVVSALGRPGTEPVHRRAQRPARRKEVVHEEMDLDCSRLEREIEPFIALPNDALTSFTPDETDPAEVEMYSVPRPNGFVQSKETLDSLLLNGHFMKYIRENDSTVVVHTPDEFGADSFEHGAIPRLRTRWRPGDPVPIVSDSPEELRPGDIVRATDLHMLCHIVDKQRSNHTCHREHFSMNPALFMPQAYKNAIIYLKEAQAHHAIEEAFRRVNYLAAAISHLKDTRKADLLEPRPVPAPNSFSSCVCCPDRLAGRKRGIDDRSSSAQTAEEWALSNQLATEAALSMPEWKETLGELYKSGLADFVTPDEIKLAVHVVAKSVDDGTVEEKCAVPAMKEMHLADMWMGGSMGSSESNGARSVECRDLPTGKNNIASGTLCHPQDVDSALARILMKMTSLQSIFSLFVCARNEDLPVHCRSKKGIHSTDYFQCLGEKQFSKGGYACPDAVDDVIKEANECRVDSTERVFLTYRLMPHLRFHFKDFVMCKKPNRDSYFEVPLRLNVKVERQRGGKYSATAADRLGYIVEGKADAWKKELSLDGWVDPHKRLCEVFFAEGHYKEHLDGVAERVNAGPEAVDCDAEEEVAAESEREKAQIRSNVKDYVDEKRSVELGDLVDFMAHNAVATAARALRKNLVTVNGKKVTRAAGGNKKVKVKAAILHQEKFRSHVGDVLCGAVMPSQDRASDVSTAYLIKLWLEHARSKGINTNPRDGSRHLFERVQVADIDEGSLDSLLLTTTLYRLTGRPEPWSAYFDGKACDGASMLQPDECDKFLRFVNATCGGTWDGNMNHWISEQMKRSLPAGVMSCPSNFKDFVTSFKGIVTGRRSRDGKSLFRRLMDVADAAPRHEKRERAVRLLKMMLDSAIASTNTRENSNTMFIAETIVRDMEEVLERPFGEVFTAHFGYGSKTGAGFISLPASREKLTKQKICEDIVAHVNGLTDDDLLGILGYYRDPRHGVRSMLNGREFNVCDAEHWLCKAYLGSAYSRGTRSYNSHHLARPHCHPTRKTGLHTHHHQELFEYQLEKFEEQIAKDKGSSFPKMPGMFRCYHEREENQSKSNANAPPVNALRKKAERLFSVLNLRRSPRFVPV